MKSLLILLSLCSFAFGQSKPAPAPRYITPHQMKIYWFNQFKIPVNTAPDYSRIVKARQRFVEDVKAGSYDTLAERHAAAFNADTALKAGDTEKATYYQAEVARLDAAIAAQDQARQQAEMAAAQAARDLQTQQLLRDIRTRLNTVSSNFSQVRNELMKMNMGN